MSPWAKLKARVAELEAELAARPAADHSCAERVRESLPLRAWEYYYACSKCGKERTVDISPGRVTENHTMQLEEDRHRAWLHSLQSPQAQMAAQQQMAEAREEAEARQRARARETNAQSAQDRADVTIAMAEGPWGQNR